MSDLLEDISHVVVEMDDLNHKAAEIRLRTIVHALDQAAYQVGRSSSKSWHGYHANVYYKDFRPPGEGAYFNPMRGLRTQGNRANPHVRRVGRA